MRCAPNSVIRRSAQVATCLVLAGAVGLGSASAATAGPAKLKAGQKWNSKKPGVSHVVPATTMPIDIGTAVAYERDPDGTIRRIL